MKTPQLKTCSKGHQFYKSSDCLSCPVCERENKPQNDFLALLSAPARRALASRNIDSLERLAEFTEAELLKLHGFGPSSLPKLRQALAVAHLKFKPSNHGQNQT